MATSARERWTGGRVPLKPAGQAAAMAVWSMGHFDAGGCSDAGASMSTSLPVIEGERSMPAL